MCSKLIRQINGTYLKDDGTNIGNLDMAAQRQLPQDILNVEYAMKNYGYVPPTSQSTSQSTPPAGMVPIPGAQYDTREKQQAVFSNIQPIGNTLYGVPKQQQQQQEQNTPENAPENNPADTFNLLIGNALSKFQGVNTADLEKKKRALQLAASDRISDITPEELRTFSPAQQAAIRSGDVSSLQPEFDEVAYQLNKAQQAAANFENVYEKIVNISGEYAEKMVAPDSVIQNYKQLIEANPDDINTYLAKVNDKTRDAILNVLDYEKMKPKEKIDTQIVTVGGRSLLVNKNTGEVIKDLESAYKETGDELEISDFDAAYTGILDNIDQFGSKDDIKFELQKQVSAGNLKLSTTEINSIANQAFTQTPEQAAKTSETFSKDWWESKIKQARATGISAKEIADYIKDNFETDTLDDLAKEAGMGAFLRGESYRIRKYIESIIE
jgi:hypothetical protein